MFKKLMKNIKPYDIGLIKLATTFFILMLVVGWTEFGDLVMKLGWYWYLVLAIVCSIPVIRKMY